VSKIIIIIIIIINQTMEIVKNIRRKRIKACNPITQEFLLELNRLPTVEEFLTRQEEEYQNLLALYHQEQQRRAMEFTRRHMITNRFRRVTSDGQIIMLNYNNNNNNNNTNN
jgi:hypothetical protein